MCYFFLELLLLRHPLCMRGKTNSREYYTLCIPATQAAVESKSASPCKGGHAWSSRLPFS